ncbi:TPA: threonine--tRNA ligase, partial [archaeon]|nr:threonine--tRNA ligase [Candidatus Naiadarchaeales archaeon SRR2090153.bin461]
MKALLQHVDYIKFEVTKETKLAQKLSDTEKKGEMKECLLYRIAAEKEDNGHEDAVVKLAVADIKDVLGQIKCKRVFLYPYVHLLAGSEPSAPHTAIKIMDLIEGQLKKDGIEIGRAPFGWYKKFELSCKGHPLSELSRVIRAGVQERPKATKLVKQTTRIDKEKLSENDHRILGPQLGLFNFQEVAPGAVFYHNKGVHIRNKLIDTLRNVQLKRGYVEINTPILMDRSLWEVSGHWDNYRDLMFTTKVEDRDFAIKPMNCPGAILFYKSSHRSYRELPLRVGEFGLVSRNELSGVLAGLFRMRTFTQDDAHIFVTQEQIEAEIMEVVDIVKAIYGMFGFEYRVELSTRPEKSIGSDEEWKAAEGALEKALKKLKMKYEIKKGEGAFYGPKIDFHIKDSLGRNWQLATIQVDFQQPQRFDLKYTDSDGKEKRPVIVHRVIYGSIDRFMGIITEHYKGAFPLWLSPVQVSVLTMTDKNVKYAEKVKKSLEEAGLRAVEDFGNHTIDYKVRNAETQKIPYILVCGDKEEEKKTIAVRNHKDGKVKYGVKLEDFAKQAQKEIGEKK